MQFLTVSAVWAWINQPLPQRARVKDRAPFAVLELTAGVLGPAPEEDKGMSMTLVQSASGRQYGLLVLAIILLLVGGVFIYLGSRNFAIRGIGLAGVMASAYVINLRSRSITSPLSGGDKDRRVTRILWIVSISLIPVLVGAWYLLHVDAEHGGHLAWPADVFAGVGLVCAVVWGLLVAKIFGGR